MKPNHLFTESKRYNWLRKYTRFIHSLYYREVCIVGKENIPSDEPVIFAPNHQNALMDALAILLHLDKQPVFMARADMFKNKRAKEFLNFLKIIPVFRIRDGVESLSNNDESFDVALQVLKSGQPIGIMPEGNHGDQHCLRPLKKGLVRFAFQAQQQFGKKPVKIIPVGLEYSHYRNFRSRLMVKFGKPIDVSQFMTSFDENNQRAYNELRDSLAEALRENMLDIHNAEYYELIYSIKDLETSYRLRKQDVEDEDYHARFLIEKEITDKLTAIADTTPERLEEVKPIVNEYISGLKKFQLRDWMFDTHKPSRKENAFDVVRYLLFLPIFLFSMALNFIPYYVPLHLSKKIKDPQFRSSVKFVLGLVIFPLYYLLFLLFPLPMITKLLIIGTVPVLGVLSFDYFIAIKKFWHKFQYYKMEQTGAPDLQRLKSLRAEVFRKIEQLLA